LQVFYYLRDLDDALTHALGAGKLFDITEKSEYVTTIVGTLHWYITRWSMIHFASIRRSHALRRSALSRDRHGKKEFKHTSSLFAYLLG
jgi:hypothetical protein